MIAAITFIQCQSWVPKGLCLVSNEWKKSSLLLLKTPSSFPNSFCVKQRMCLNCRGGSSYAMLWLQQEFAEQLAVWNPSWTSLHLSNMPKERQDNRRKSCPLCLCSLLRDAHEQSPKWTKPEWISECFPFMKCLLLYVLAVPLYLYTTKPLGGGYVF